MVSLSRLYHFNFFKGCLVPILLVPFLNILSQICQRLKIIEVSKIYLLIFRLLQNIAQWKDNEIAEKHSRDQIMSIISNTQNFCSNYLLIMNCFTQSFLLLIFSLLRLKCKRSSKQIISYHPDISCQ